MIRAQHAEFGVARLHTALELLEAPLVDRAKRLDVHRQSPFYRLAGRKTPRIRTAVARFAAAAALPLSYGGVISASACSKARRWSSENSTNVTRSTSGFA